MKILFIAINLIIINCLFSIENSLAKPFYIPFITETTKIISDIFQGRSDMINDSNNIKMSIGWNNV